MLSKMMNTKTTGIKWQAIALFYVISLLIRAIVLRYMKLGDGTFTDWLWRWAGGHRSVHRSLGGCLGVQTRIMLHPYGQVDHEVIHHGCPSRRLMFLA